MKAIVYTRYGAPDVLEFKDVPQPVPAPNQVLVRLCAASVNPLDWHFMRGSPWPIRFMTGLLGPKSTILGSDIAGRVEAVGTEVTRFKPGDEVFGAVLTGGFAEFVCAKEDQLALKPANLSFEQAAAVPIAAITALQGLRDHGRIQRGQKVLIEGASGGVGTFAIQIAKSFRAEVTAVCSAGKMETAQLLGADFVLDYQREDFTSNRLRYNLILSTNASHSIFDYQRSLTYDGIFVMAGGKPIAGLQMFLLGGLLSRFGPRKIGGMMAKMNQKDMADLVDLLESGRVVPVIDRCYPLSRTADAIRYLEEGHARGKVILTVE
jgi:NADPH:quinone reductase-like Zn-dependent oxidoreductase